MLKLDKSHALSEEDLLRGWESDEVKVSVLCICFNHEKYLSQAIESFLAQETDFAFEIERKKCSLH